MTITSSLSEASQSVFGYKYCCVLDPTTQPVRYVNDDILFTLNFCIYQLDYIWVHACCRLNQPKPLMPDLLVTVAAVHSTFIVRFSFGSDHSNRDIDRAYFLFWLQQCCKILTSCVLLIPAGAATVLATSYWLGNPCLSSPVHCPFIFSPSFYWV